MKKIFFFASFFLNIFNGAHAHSKLPRTVAGIELGSGGVRLTIAKTDHGVIHEIYEQRSYVLSIMKHLNNSCIIEDEMAQVLLEKLQEFKDVADTYNAKQINAIATEVFRKVDNGEEIVRNLSEKLGFNIHIVDQVTEGKIGYLTSRYLTQQSGLGLSLVSWDTGSGSEQLASVDMEGEIQVYMTPLGFVITGDQIFAKQIRKIEPRKSYNPITQEEVDEFIVLLKESSPEVPAWLQEAASAGNVVRQYTSKTLSKLFPVAFEASKTPKVSLDEIKQVISRLVDKTDAEIELEFGGNFSYIGRLAIDIAMLQATMEHIGIQEITYVHDPSPSGNTCGLLLFSEM